MNAGQENQVTVTGTLAGAAREHDETRFKIIGKGGATSFLVQATISTTINANGELTSSVENVSIRCR